MTGSPPCLVPAGSRRTIRSTCTPAPRRGTSAPAFLALAAAGSIRGRVPGAGCGTGEHALLFAALDLAATGIGLAARARLAAVTRT